MADLSPQTKFKPITSFPLLALVLVAYNAALLSGHNFTNPAAGELLHLKLISGAEWSLGWNEALLIGGLVMLFIEIMKSTRTTTHTMFEHILSMFVFIIFLVEFLIVAGAGTTTFMLLGLMSLTDVMGGYSISIAVARKEMNITG